MTVADLVDALVEAGASPLTIKIAVRAYEDASARKTAADELRRARNKRYQDGKRLSKTSYKTQQDVLEASQSVLKTSENGLAHDAPIRAGVLCGAEEEVVPPMIATLSSPKPPIAKRSTPRSRIAPDAQPSKKDAERALSANLSADQFRTEWRKFRDHHTAVGSLMADWEAAWSKWLGNIKQFNRPVNNGKQSVQDAARDLVEQIAERSTIFGDRPKPLLAYVGR